MEISAVYVAVNTRVGASIEPRPRNRISEATGLSSLNYRQPWAYRPHSTCHPYRRPVWKEIQHTTRGQLKLYFHELRAPKHLLTENGGRTNDRKVYSQIVPLDFR